MQNVNLVAQRVALNGSACEVDCALLWAQKVSQVLDGFGPHEPGDVCLSPMARVFEDPSVTVLIDSQ